MRALFLITLVAFGSFAQGRFDRFTQRTSPGRSTRGLSDSSGAFLEFAPESGAGMGTACACAAITGAKGEAITFTRASVAECYSNDGQTLTQCSTNQPLVSSGRVDSTLLGLWREEARQNDALHSRDLSQAIWVKVNMSCPRTATGMRNDANGASTCTASAANGTALQTITKAAATNSTSFHVKRRTGTGGVDVTIDNGVTWTSITSRLSSSVWRRVVPYPTAGCVGGNCIVVSQMLGTAANPVIGIRIQTSGDAVDVDFVQNEAGDGATSPILTAGTATPRAVDSATASYTNSIGCLGVRLTGAATTTSYALLPYVGGNQFAALGFGVRSATLESSVSAQWWLNPTNSTVNSTFATPLSGSIYYQASQPTTTLTRSCLSGACNQTATAALTYTSAAHTVYLGTTQVNTAHVNGVVSQVVIDPSPSRCPENFASQNLSIAWVGDSIVAGTGSSPGTPPFQLKSRIDPGSVFNFGTGGYTIAQCGARYSAAIASGGHRTLIWSCGVNDMAAGTAGATAATAAQVFLADARARGLKVIITGIMPWKNSAGWTLAKQTETVAYNSAMSTWAGANGAFYVPTIASMGGGGGDPDVLAVAYDSGDLIHPNSAGSLQFATLVFAQTP